MLTLLVAGVAILATASCGGGDDATPPGDVPAPDPDGPVILSLSATAYDLSVGMGIDINAIVTDPQGIADVIGGELGTTGGTIFRNFATSAEEGAYRTTSTYGEIAQVAIDEGGQPAAKLRITFYDQAGHRTSQDLSFSLTCDISPYAQWCPDRGCTDDFCGGCDTACINGNTCLRELDKCDAASFPANIPAEQCADWCAGFEPNGISHSPYYDGLCHCIYDPQPR